MFGTGKIIIKGEARVGEARGVKGEALESLLLWKPRAGEALTVSDERGCLFRARLTALDDKEARLRIFEESGRLKTPFPLITLLQALPEKERMELIIQKTAELGVSRIIPFKSCRSISLEERDFSQKKSHRWAGVALKASKQSRRETIPEVLPYRGFMDALKEAGKEDLMIMLSEKKGITGLKDFLAGRKKDGGINGVTLLSGPEGGFTEEEVREASKRGFTPVSLGPRTLRTETASIIGVGIILYELEGC